MLTNLHVKNLALIEEADINFFDGLNIMTGETGAGKSIILGSVNIALGGKVTADIIRKGAEYALTELAFHIDDKKKIAALKDMDIEDAQDGDVIISRKIMPGRSQIKVNGMICTVSQVKSIASLLIDIHGQHDSQLLLKESSHLDMIDLYGGSTVSDVRKRYDVVYKQYREALSQLEQMDTDEESRQREISFIEFELHEIASADLKRGEDEELESGFRKMSNSQRIISDLSTAVQLLSEGSDNVMDMMGIAVKSVIEASSFDESLKSVADSCSCAEDMISDVCRQISDYVNDSSYDEEEYKEVEVKFIFLEIQGCDGTVCFNLQSINYFQIFIHHSLSRTMVIFLFYTLYHTPYCIRHTHHIPVRHHRSRRQTEPTVEQGFRYPVDVGGGGGEYGL